VQLRAEIDSRAAELLRDHQRRIYERTDRMFAYLMALEWLASVAAALWISPRAWAGTASWTHPHVWAAVFLGGIVAALPIWLALTRPGATLTRHVVAAGQMLMSALLIHLTGGRIETHFHVFGSLAFLSFYRDWKVFIPATIVVAVDHLWRGLFWPESVFGIVAASPWRWLEHAGWVLFEDAFLILSCRQSVEEMREIARQRAQLEGTQQVIEAEVVERTAELEELQKRHLEVARRAGMAEIATSVLHNVGNVLNSVNVSAAAIGERLRSFGVSDLNRAADLLESRRRDLKTFLTEDSRGLHVPQFVIELSRQMARDEEAIRTEIGCLTKSIEHIKDIVTVQQSYAGVAGFVEEVSIAELIDDAIRINSASLGRHHIEIVCELEELPRALLAKQKFLQVVVNLLSNAKYAVMESRNPERRIVVRLAKSGDDRVRLEIGDTGVGISSENLTRIFSHGFTTRKEGHGFGLHSAANLVQEMDGVISASSEGPERGATFVVEVPLKSTGVKSCQTATA
jgi:signal transduction histidine kinase